MKKSLLFIPLMAIGSLSCNNSKKLKVIWKNYDNTVLEEDSVNKGDKPSYHGDTPTRESSESFVYKFNGWSPEISEINEDTTYTAQFREVERIDVIFKDGNDEILYETYTDIEDTDIESKYKGKVPAKEHQGDIYYYFDGWNNPEITNFKTYIYKPKFVQCKIDDDQDNDGIPDYLDPYPKNNEVNVSLSFHYMKGFEETVINDAKFKIDYLNMFASDDVDPTVFNKDIAVLGSVINTENIVSSYGTVTINNKIKTRMKYQNIFEYLGCDNVELYFDDTEYEKDPNDVGGFIIAHKLLKLGNNKRDFIFINMDQKYRTGSGWLSNFDVGFDGDEYYTKEGNEHDSSWKNNTDLHKGFCVTAARLYEQIVSRISNYENPIIFLSGHSRGGAIANILGDMLNKKYNKDIKLFVYTYAAPNTIFSSEEDSGNKNIFNIVNGDDCVPMFPISSWYDGNKYPTKYGVTKTIFLSEYTKEFSRLTSKSYDYVNNLKNLLDENFKISREQLYTLEDSGYSGTFKTKLDAENYVEEIKTSLRNCNLDENTINTYFQFEINQNFELTIKTALSSGFKIAYGIISGGEAPSTSILLDLFKKYETPVLKLILNGLTSVKPIGEPHYLTSYYLISNHAV